MFSNPASFHAKYVQINLICMPVNSTSLIQLLDWMCFRLGKSVKFIQDDILVNKLNISHMTTNNVIITDRLSVFISNVQVHAYVVVFICIRGYIDKDENYATPYRHLS